MPRYSMFASVACLVLSACGRSAAVPDRQEVAGGPVADSAANSAPGETDDFVVAAPVRHGNLTIFPVISKVVRSEDRFITLNEGLKAGTVEIRELGARPDVATQSDEVQQAAAIKSDDDQAAVEDDTAAQEAANDDTAIAFNDVNRLVVINRGDKPLYLMPGEIIVGGSQDRTIGEEMVIAPTGEPVPIDVYCVEHGRWGARDVTIASLVIGEVADEAADAESLAAEADKGKFVAQAGNLSKASRLAVQTGEGQQKVWEEVARANSESGVAWSSDAFTANYVDKKVLDRLKPFEDALNCPISDQERVVGVVVAINGKIETVDVFESTPLFLKLWPQLLKSYALDAMQVAEADDAKKTSTPGEAAEFLASILRNQNQEGEPRKTEGGLVVSRHETSDRISFSAGAMGGMAGGMGMFGAPVHSSGFSK